jgi:hypothetical protein
VVGCVLCAVALPAFRQFDERVWRAQQTV